MEKIQKTKETKFKKLRMEELKPSVRNAKIPKLKASKFKALKFKTMRSRLIRGSVAALSAAVIGVAQFPMTSHEILAAGLTQSSDHVEVNLTHSHTSACESRTWVSCGGTWQTNWEPYVGTTVYYCSNNMSLPEIHDNYTMTEHSGTHDGEYVTKLNCSLGSVGKLVIDRTTEGEKVLLTAQLENPTETISDYSITWNRGDVEAEEEDSSEIALVGNGTYTATVNWTDAKTGASRSQTLSFSDVSQPIHFTLKSDGNTVFETDVAYGETLPEVEPLEKTGYIFEGYEWNGTKIYDENGKPLSSASTELEELNYEAGAIWTARNYTIHYGTDEDKDGIGDREMQVTFGEEYAAIDTTAEKENDKFLGYYYDGQQIFDREGNPTGVWSWDVEDGITLERHYYVPPKNDSTDDDNDNANSNSQSSPSAKPSANATATGSPSLLPSASPTDVDDNSSASENNIPSGLPGNPVLTDNNPDSGTGTSSGQGGNSTNTDHQNQSTYHNPYDIYGYGPDGGRGTGSIYEGRNLICPTQNSEDDLNPEDTDLREQREEVELTDLNSEGEGNELKNLVETDSQEDSLQEQLSQEEIRKERTKKVVVITSSAVAGTAALGGIGYMIWILWISAGVYTEMPDHKKKRIGLVVVNKKYDDYEISLSQNLLDKSMTGKYRIELPKLFLNGREGKVIRIVHPKGKIQEVIRENIRFEL